MGIALMKLILEKDVGLKEGQVVTVNWERKKVQAEILAVYGKLLLFPNFVFSKSPLISLTLIH